MEIDPHEQPQSKSLESKLPENKLPENKLGREGVEKHTTEKLTISDRPNSNNLTSNNLTSNNLKSNNPRSKSLVLALGLDVGRKRIGVAGCDRTGLIATGITTIERTSFQRDVEQIRQLVTQRQINVLVVGLPYSMDGSLGFQARQVKKFAYRVGKALELPIEYIDERLTSYQAEQLIIAQKGSPSRNKGLIDRKAASLILQRWLDARVRS